MSGALLAPFLFGVLATLFIAPGIVYLYRQAVLRVMLSGKETGRTLPPVSPQGPRAALGIDFIDEVPASAASSALYLRARRLRLTLLGMHVIAGSAALMILSLNWALHGRPDDWNLIILFKIFGLFASALIPVAATVGVGNRRFRLALIPAFIVVLVALVLLPDTRDMAIFVVMSVLPPILYLLLVANRWLKTSAPLVLIAAISSIIASLISPYIALATGIFALSWIVSTFGFVFGILAIGIVARLYAAKRISDQLLLIDVYWFLVCAWQAMSTMDQSHYWWLAIFALAAYKGVQLALLPFVVHDVRTRPPAQLLLLRVFGSQKRSEELIEEIGIRWRFLGPIHIICGTDVATADLDPVELWQFLKWQTRDLSVRDSRDLDRRLADLDIAPDPDGRHRVNDFFCRDDTWRMTVVRLLDRADAVLLDARGFSAQNRGVVFELHRLLSSKPLSSLIVIAGHSQNEETALRTIVAEAWAAVEPASVNASARNPRLRVLRVGGDRLDAAHVVSALCAAATEGVAASAKLPVNVSYNPRPT